MVIRKRQSIATWLALFAMLMIYAGPLISQSQAWAEATHVPDDCPHHETSIAGHHSGADAETLPAKADCCAGWERCGYCTLLMSTPPMTTAISVIPWYQPLPFALSIYPDGPFFSHEFFSAHPRAPPAFLES